MPADTKYYQGPDFKARPFFVKAGDLKSWQNNLSFSFISIKASIKSDFRMMRLQPIQFFCPTVTSFGRSRFFCGHPYLRRFKSKLLEPGCRALANSRPFKKFIATSCWYRAAASELGCMLLKRPIYLWHF